MSPTAHPKPTESGNSFQLELSVSAERRQFRRKLNGGRSMLWTIFVILLVLWLLGFIGFHVLGAYIHFLLVIALVVLLFQLLSGRRPVV
jgi:hypothetical protein